MAECTLCPRRCKAQRPKEKGFCGVGALRVARAALHFWEEPCISGESGSGTVFFSGCTLRCVYCQNKEISRGEAGAEISVQRLSEIFLELQSKGAHNINLVTPDHYAPEIRDAVIMAKERGLSIPIVVNTGGYLSDEILDIILPVADIFLTDFKYMSAETGEKYSLAPDYPEVAKRALKRMVDGVGELRYDDEGIMQKGVIVRHLMLPGGLSDSKAVVKYLFETYGHGIILSLMSQYTPPAEGIEKFPELAERVDPLQYEELIDYAVDLGVENAFTQEGEAADESFIPPFDLEGVMHP